MHPVHLIVLNVPSIKSADQSNAVSNMRREGKSIGNIPTNTEMGEKILPFPRRSTMWMIIFIIIHQFTAFCGSIAKGGSRTGQSFCYNIFKQEEDTTLNYGPSCLLLLLPAKFMGAFLELFVKSQEV